MNNEDILTIKILGTKYTIEEVDKDSDSFLEEADGYCDVTSKRIVITKEYSENGADNWEERRKKLLRHEIVHAFLFESGLHENFRHKKWGHDETIVDWIAVQSPKMLKVFKKIGCL